MSGPASPAPAIASPIRSRGWPLIFLGTGLTTLAAGTLALLLPPLLKGRGVGEATIGVVVASAGIASFLTRVPAGVAYRRGRASVLIGLGAAVTTASFAMIPVVHATAAITVLVALDGAAFALASTTAMAAVADRRPVSMPLGGLMGWFTGSIGAGYSLAAYVAGAFADAVGIVPAIRTAAVVPPVAAAVMWVGLARLRSDPRAEGSSGAVARPGLRGLLGSLPVAVWVASLVALYINFGERRAERLLPDLRSVDRADADASRARHGASTARSPPSCGSARVRCSVASATGASSRCSLPRARRSSPSCGSRRRSSRSP